MKKIFLCACLAIAAALAGCAGTDVGGLGANDSELEAPPVGIEDGGTQYLYSEITEEYFEAEIGHKVYFAVDQSAITEEIAFTLDRQAGWLLENPNYDALVEGHTDEQGTREYNLALGARRANSVRDYLIDKGIAGNRIRIVTYGKERPESLCSDEACWSANRRAVTVLTERIVI
ncbi:MAG: peptidoglycan-associated lipoprotein Pal [Albidovulum sp.]|nr:peptidoglycan-associated lipoprotein Pal [Albidovulum sp.]